MIRSITLSNLHRFSFMVASGALAFDGLGWPWERPLVKLGVINPRLFTVVMKTITVNPLVGNLKLHRPWTCIRPIKGGWVNRVGLTNPGMDWWYKEIGHKVRRTDISLVGSAYGSKQDILSLITTFNQCDLVGVELNVSCPNTGHGFSAAETEYICDVVEEARTASKHPLILKLSVAQPYISIARRLSALSPIPIGAISLNSVPWEMVYPQAPSPLDGLEKRLGTPGKGGVSGKAAQNHTWKAVAELSRDPENQIPVIGPSVWSYGDIGALYAQGAQAISFGAVHIARPWAPTHWVKRIMREDAHMPGIGPLAFMS